MDQSIDRSINQSNNLIVEKGLNNLYRTFYPSSDQKNTNAKRKVSMAALEKSPIFRGGPNK